MLLIFMRVGNQRRRLEGQGECGLGTLAVVGNVWRAKINKYINWVN